MAFGRYDRCNMKSRQGKARRHFNTKNEWLQYCDWFKYCCMHACMLTLAFGPKARKSDRSPSGNSNPQLTAFLFSTASSSLSSYFTYFFPLRGGRLDPGGSKILKRKKKRKNGKARRQTGNKPCKNMQIECCEDLMK